MDQPIVIEEAQPSDMESILELQKLSFQDEVVKFNDYAIPPFTQTIESIREDFSNNFYLKASIDSKIIGSVRAFLEDNTCHIGRLFVHPEYQNLGIGKALMQNIETRFKECNKFSLYTAKRVSKNMHFYPKLGYVIEKEELVREGHYFVYFEKDNK